jgi:hypothetical protein
MARINLQTLVLRGSTALCGVTANTLRLGAGCLDYRGLAIAISMRQQPDRKRPAERPAPWAEPVVNDHVDGRGVVGAGRPQGAGSRSRSSAFGAGPAAFGWRRQTDRFAHAALSGKAFPSRGTATRTPPAAVSGSR